MKLSIIIVNFNGVNVTKNCISSLYRFLDVQESEVIVVDNNSSDASRTELPALFPQIVFHQLHENKGFGAANNAGAKIASGEILFFLNNDTLLTSEITEKLTRILMSVESYGIVAPRLMNGNGSFQLSFGKHPTIANEMNSRKRSNDLAAQQLEAPLDNHPVQKEWVTGAAFLIRKMLFQQIGGFNEEYFMYFEDADICKRVRNVGYSVWYVPEASLIHLGGMSYTKGNQQIEYEYRRSQLLFYSEHNTFFEQCLVRIFLWMKYVPQLFLQSRRSMALKILSLTISRS
ncbi:MAG: glycosyltransferase family 2 protein [Bacteroidetes bacterium]|nr:glycosyltransferase family 2 protein [Bacteroidota bacterium]